MNDLQAIAAEYAAHGLTVIPALPGLKEAAVNWKAFQVDAPSERERNALFAEPNLNIAVVCGAVSGNVMQIDAETPRAFEAQYKLCHRAGLADTWVDNSPSGGGHFTFRLPYPVKTRGKVEDVEILSEGRISLLPPSIAVSKTDGALHAYEIVNRPAQILTLESPDELHWLKLERAALQTQFRAFPRRAQKLLEGGEWDRQRYGSRSEVEQAIIASLVGAGFGWESILSAFRRYPAAGKFSSIYQADPHAGIEWLRLSWNEARRFHAETESPARKNALDLFNYAAQIPWRGSTGSTMRACFTAHCGLSYRSGRRIYHASSRSLSEFAGIDKNTASAATLRLRAAGAVAVVQPAAFTFAAQYELPLLADFQRTTATSLSVHTKEIKRQKEKPVGVSQFKTENQKTRTCIHSINPKRVRVYESPCFLTPKATPEAFRRRALGLCALECLYALRASPLTALQLAEVTGRHVETVRKALKKMKERGLAAKQGKHWCAQAIENIDLDALAVTVAARGAAKAQKEQHNADRLRHKLRLRVRQLGAQGAHGGVKENAR